MRLHYQSLGSGNPVVLLHGLFGSLDNLRPVALGVSHSFRVFLLDQRNHGRSPHSVQFDYATMAGDVVEFLEEHQLPWAHVLGHSMGGKTAMRLALDHPQLVRSLIVADVSPRAYPRHHDPLLTALRSLDLASCHTREQLEGALQPAVPELAVRRFLLKNVARTPSGFTWRIGLAEIAANYRRLSEAVTAETNWPGPALFMRGENSDYIRDSDLPALRRLFPAAELQTVPSAGHWVHVDNLPVFNALVLDFLKRVCAFEVPA